MRVGLERLRAEQHRARLDFLHLARHAVDVHHAGRLVRRRVGEDLVDHRVGDERGVARLERVGDRGEGRVEIRVRRAALLARPAVVTGRPAVDRLGDVGRAAERDRPSQLLLDPRAQLHLGAAHGHGGMELAVGQLRNVLRLAGDADVVLDQLVVRDQILVAERPVLAVAVEGLALQVLLAEPIALAAPDVGASADHARAALPAERLVVRIGVRLVEVVGEPLVVPLAARVAVALLRPRPPHQVARLVAVLEVVGGDVLGEVLVALRLARFEQGHLDAGFRQSLGRPATRGARSHHDHIELRRLHVVSAFGRN